MKKRRRLRGCLLLLLLTVLLSGCSLTKSASDKLEDLDFTIVPDEDVPEELGKLIEEKKQNSMNLTFLDEDALYIIVGYGTQKTTGYSVGVEELYRTEDGIVVDTTLIGPEKDEAVTEVDSYPYVVLKTQRSEELVTFE